MKLQEFLDHKQDIEYRKQNIQQEEKDLDHETRKFCVESFPEFLKIDWNMIRRSLRHSN